jgi:hypothetical protein
MRSFRMVKCALSSGAEAGILLIAAVRAYPEEVCTRPIADVLSGG